MVLEIPGCFCAFFFLSFLLRGTATLRQGTGLGPWTPDQAGVDPRLTAARVRGGEQTNLSELRLQNRVCGDRTFIFQTSCLIL